MFHNDITTTAPVGNPKQWCPQVSIPQYLMMWPELCAGAKLVYAALVHMSESSHGCSYNIVAIAIRAGLRRDQTQKHLTTLAKLGLISKYRQFKDKNVYVLHLHPILRGEYPDTDSSTSRTAIRTVRENYSEYSSTCPGVITYSSTHHERLTRFPVPPGTSPRAVYAAEMAAKLAFQRSLECPIQRVL
jgi:hypothetical protein